MASYITRASRAISLSSFRSDKHRYEFTCKVETLVIDSAEEPYTLRIKWKRKKEIKETKWVSATKNFMFNDEIMIPAKMVYHPENATFDPKPSELLIEQKDGQHICQFGKIELDLSKYCNHNVDEHVTKELLEIKNCTFPNVFLNIEITCIKQNDDPSKQRIAKSKSDEATDSDGGSSAVIKSRYFQTEEDPNMEHHLRMQINDLTLQITDLEGELEMSRETENKLKQENDKLRAQLSDALTTKDFDAEDTLFSQFIAQFAKYDTELQSRIIGDIETTHNVETVDGEVVPPGASEQSLLRQIKELEIKVVQTTGEKEQLRLKLKRLEAADARGRNSELGLNQMEDLEEFNIITN